VNKDGIAFPCPNELQQQQRIHESDMKQRQLSP
jgi:hypothetical protein